MEQNEPTQPPRTLDHPRFQLNNEDFLWKCYVCYVVLRFFIPQTLEYCYYLISDSFYCAYDFQRFGIGEFDVTCGCDARARGQRGVYLDHLVISLLPLAPRFAGVEIPAEPGANGIEMMQR